MEHEDIKKCLTQWYVMPDIVFKTHYNPSKHLLKVFQYYKETGILLDKLLRLIAKENNITAKELRQVITHKRWYFRKGLFAPYHKALKQRGFLLKINFLLGENNE